MSTTLQEIRDYVRLHMDLDASELPDLLIDTWAREATTRIWKARTTWTFMEATFDLQLLPNQQDYDFDDIDSTLDEITSIYRSNYRLDWIGRNEGEANFLPYITGNGLPRYWNTWEGKLRLYPAPTTNEVVTVRGYLAPSDWTRVTGGAGKVPFPDEFANTVRLWVIGAAYLQQEDTELGITYADMFNDELSKLVRRFGVSPAANPLVIGGGVRRSQLARLSFPWEG